MKRISLVLATAVMAVTASFGFFSRSDLAQPIVSSSSVDLSRIRNRKQL